MGLPPISPKMRHATSPAVTMPTIFASVCSIVGMVGEERTALKPDFVVLKAYTNLEQD